VSSIKKLIDLSGRRALITGAAGGLGKIFAGALAELGADLILVDHPDSELETLRGTLISRWGINVEIHFCDLEIQDQRARLLAKLQSSNAGLNILVNNAAFVGTSDLEGLTNAFEEQSISTWNRVISVNLTAIFELCQGLLPILKLATGANIINISSIYGKYGPDLRLYEGTSMGSPVAYAVSKGGLIQFTRWLATVAAPEVRVNAICPGGIFRNQPDQFVNRYESRTPLKRMACEEDLIGAVAYLASDLSAYVTGHELMVDGGWGIW
jgi:NAD(P)-dependent dehydrogenase (short-subunit alcohol dehydrogenase family)